MKKEQIEAARDKIGILIKDAFMMGVALHRVDDAKNALYALCAAASEDEILVGRRVRIVKGYYSKETGVTVKRCYYVRFDWPPDGTEGNAFNRDDFELLEDA